MAPLSAALALALALAAAPLASSSSAPACASCAGGSTAVGTAPYTLSLFCADPAQTLSAFPSIYWGDNDSGVCGAAANSSDPCDGGGNATRVRAAVEGSCLGRVSCSLNVTTNFLGSNCAPKTPRPSPVLRLTVSAACSGGGAVSSTCGSLGPGLFFSNQLTDYAVLQRAPAAAALYGYVPRLSYAAGATVSVSLTDESDPSAPPVVATSAPIADDAAWGIATWKAVLPPMLGANGGGSFTAAATCSGCAALPFFAAPTVIRHLTFGDVWLCSGQSNAQLSMRYTFGLNDSTAAIKRGELANIRYFSTEYADSYAIPQFVQQKYINGGYFNSWTPAAGLVGQPGGDWLVDVYATCFYFAQELTRLLDAAAGGLNKGVPVGIIGTAQGGTQIESWLPIDAQLDAGCSEVSCMCATPHCNASQPLNAQNCTNNGGLFNGLIAPYANLTIKGAVWYQVRRASVLARSSRVRACTHSRYLLTCAPRTRPARVLLRARTTSAARPAMCCSRRATPACSRR